MAERDGILNFATPGVDETDQPAEWTFNSLKTFKKVVKKYRNTLPEDDTPVIWCEFDGIGMDFDTFEEILNEFG